MIVVIGKVQTTPEKRDELVRIGQTVARASREEAGCRDYRLNADTEDPDRFVFVEEWESEEALQTHFRTPHIATFMSEIFGVVTAPPEVRFHTVESTRDLSEVGAR